MYLSINAKMKVKTSKQKRRGRDNFVGAIAECIIGILDNLMTYFNHYAFTQVAIYGYLCLFVVCMFVYVGFFPSLSALFSVFFSLFLLLIT
jgi:hypothetical protein